MTTFSGGEKAHAEFGASSAERWLACPGSVQLSRKVPEQSDSSFAKEGTQAHECLEFILRNRANSGKAVVMARARYPEAMIIHAEMALRVVEADMVKHPTAILLIEERADLPVSHPGQGGTIDVAAVEEFGWLIVTDYKYGAGIPVDVKENAQLIYYALCIAHKYDYNFTKVKLRVIQPRAQIDGEFVREWVTDIDTLLRWRVRFESGIKAALKPKPIMNSGEHCRFCRGALICKEVGKKAFKAAQLDFDSFNDAGTAIVPTDLPALPSPEKVAQYLAALPRIRKWMESVEEYAFTLARKGTRIPGYKLVEKKGQRRWLQTANVEKFARQKFGDEAFTAPEIKSPAQVEKIGGAVAKKFVKEWSTNVSSGLTLVRDSDPRRATSSAAKDFPDDLEDW